MEVSMAKFNSLNCFLIIVLCLVINGIAFCGSSSDQTKVSRWVKENFAKGVVPPFSFVYEGKPSRSFITNWEYSAEKLKSTGPDIEESIYTYSDGKSGIVVKCSVTCFNDFNAVEWVVRFKNTSSQNTPIIERAAVIDNSFSYDQIGTFILHHSRGSDALKNDFQPFDDKMQIGKNIYMTPSRGRSSDDSAFPFFNIESPAKQGIMVAVGWTGKWYADVLQQDEKSVSLKSGMENMHLTLYPQEEIRTPKICLLFWQGEDRMIGHNQFRRFILAHHSRKINGKLAEYPLSGGFDYGDPLPCGEYECLTEDFALALVKRYQQFNIMPELFWLDAGWYTGCGFNKEHGKWDENVGNWTVDKERFPDGLRSISDSIHAAGCKFMLWFEPERVREGTQFYKEHPEWLLGRQGSRNFIFNLGNKEARLWLTNYISGFIKKEGIDYYRQDFNIDPKSYWKDNDTPDRIGISEEKHIEGLYAFWDSLLVRFPNLIIDNCASGGRRIDLETVSRSAPFWRSDYQYGEPNGYQCHAYGLNFYLPVHGTAVYKTDNFSFRSSLGATMVMAWEITGKNDEPINDIQKCMSEFKRLRPYFYGDYYPLTEAANHYMGNSSWLAYQLNRPEQKDGIILAFRREDVTNESIRINLRGLDENANYEMYYEDYGLRVYDTGKKLMDGIDIMIPTKPASLLISYKKVEN